METIFPQNFEGINSFSSSFEHYLNWEISCHSESQFFLRHHFFLEALGISVIARASEIPPWCILVKVSVSQACLTLFDPMDCCLPGSSVHGIFQARILEWVTISFSRRSSQPRDRTTGDVTLYKERINRTWAWGGCKWICKTAFVSQRIKICIIYSSEWWVNEYLLYYLLCVLNILN